MKKITTLSLVIGALTIGKSQLHKNMDGSPDMRYKENKTIYGNPSSSMPSYNNNANIDYPSVNSTSTNFPNTSITPSYSNPSTQERITIPSYPTKKDGTPDMRFKENRSLYRP